MFFEIFLLFLIILLIGIFVFIKFPGRFDHTKILLLIKRRKRVIQGIMGLVFLLPGMALMLWSLSFWLTYFKSWKEVPAIIESVELLKQASYRTTRIHYSVECQYRYQWNNQTFIGNRVDIEGGESAVERFNFLKSY